MARGRALNKVNRYKTPVVLGIRNSYIRKISHPEIALPLWPQQKKQKCSSYVRTEWLVGGECIQRARLESVNSSKGTRSALDVQINTSWELMAPRDGRSCTMSATVAGKWRRHRATSVRLYKLLSGVISGDIRQHARRALPTAAPSAYCYEDG